MKEDDLDRESCQGKYNPFDTWHPWRRFFARSIDLLILGPVAAFGFMLIFFVTGQSIFANALLQEVNNIIIAPVALYLLYIPFEALLISKTRTTLGKFIFGIKVIHRTGEKLSYTSALKRAYIVWLRGDGLGLPVVSFLTRLHSYIILRKTRTTPWDKYVDSVLLYKEFGVMRAIFCTITVIAMIIVINISYRILVAG
jgi:uncharacterized RDD family membrane protein YckC